MSLSRPDEQKDVILRVDTSTGKAHIEDLDKNVLYREV
jgi:hypothetical protein